MKTVMIVDDNYLSVEGIIKNINWEQLDARVLHVAYSGESALEALRLAPVDLIISDIEMPNLDGISMSSVALSMNPLVKIILISAYDKFEYAKQAIRLGVCDYIEKPVDYQYLTEKVKNAFSSIDRERRNMELYALKYRFFFPHKNIFDARETPGQEFSLLSISDSREEELISLLCQKNLPAVDTWLHDFFEDLSRKCLAKNILFIRIYSLLGRILKFLYELNIDTSELESEIVSVYNRFDRFDTYEQFYQWMSRFCSLVCQKLDTSQNTYHNQICELAVGYIRENFEDHTLCLNDIARHVNVSPAYLSALYRKNTGQSISDTIASFRIEEACRYLTESNLSLKDISSRCGYANQYYFSNSFKKKLGISPSAYRESKKTSVQK